MANLTLGSLFDGSGGFPLAGMLCGIKPVWASEIEPFPIRVTTKRLPTVKHLGDVNKINGAKIEPVDIITAGFPCQDASIAGRRRGLHGEKTGLFFQVVRIIKEMRAATDNAFPRFAVLENVPGIFSSNKGLDFCEVLNELVKIKDETLSVPMPDGGKWLGAGEIHVRGSGLGDDFSLAFRVLDSQFFGVAQRRRRCYFVVDLNGGCAGEILFNETRLRGNPSPCRLPWQAAPGSSADGAGIPSEKRTAIGFEPGAMSRLGGHYWDNLMSTLRAGAGDNLPAVVYDAGNNFPAVVYDARGNGDGNVANTMTGDHNGHISDYTSLAVMPKTLKIRSGKPGGGKGALVQDDISATLGCGNDQTVFVPKRETDMNREDANAVHRGQPGSDTGRQAAVTAFGISSYSSNAMKSPNPQSGVYEAETSRTLDSNCCRPDMNQGGIAIVAFAQNQREEVRNLGECSGALSAEAGTHQQTYVLQGSMINRELLNGPQGSGVNEGVSFSLTSRDRHAVCYQDVVGTLSASDYKFPQQQQIHEDKAIVEQLTVGDYRVSGYGGSPDASNAKGEVPPNEPGGKNPSAESRYVVRRLLPSECAALQGFPTTYCSELETSEPTEEDIAFWSEVFETHRKIMGTSTKPKSRNQIIKWLRDPYCDSAEFRLWGNGVTLNVVVFVLGGIVWAVDSEASIAGDVTKG